MTCRGLREAVVIDRMAPGSRFFGGYTYSLLVAGGDATTSVQIDSLGEVPEINEGDNTHLVPFDDDCAPR